MRPSRQGCSRSVDLTVEAPHLPRIRATERHSVPENRVEHPVEIECGFSDDL